MTLVLLVRDLVAGVPRKANFDLIAGGPLPPVLPEEGAPVFRFFLALPRGCFEETGTHCRSKEPGYKVNWSQSQRQVQIAKIPG